MRARLVALCLGMWLVSSRAWATAGQEPERTAVLVMQGEDALLREITVRLTGELAAAGYRVQSVRGREESPRLSIERAGAEHPSTALILVRSDAQVVELWISDRVLGKTSNLRLTSEHAEPSERARRLSVEAVEVLRARLAELSLAEPAATAGLVETAPRAPPEPRVPWRTQLALGAGLQLLFRPHLLSAAAMPALAAELWLERSTGAPHPALGLGLSAAGHGTTSQRDRDEGTSELRQGIGLVRFALRWVARTPLEPELSLGAGVYAAGVQGRAEAPYVAHDVRSFSPALSQALGVRARLLSWLALRVAGELTEVLEKSSIQIAERQVARTGGLLFGGRLELLAVLW